jgi:thiazole synthase
VSVATLVTSLLGNPFRTTLYFGHMVHKSNGARAGYSVPRGAAVMLIRMTGLVPTVLHWLPLAVVAMVMVWSGLVMLGQAFQEVSKKQCVAVLAAWAALSCFGVVPLTHFRRTEWRQAWLLGGTDILDQLRDGWVVSGGESFLGCANRRGVRWAPIRLSEREIPALAGESPENTRAEVFITIGIMIDPLIIAGREFRSRLIVGTGKYKSFQETARALEASGADMVTVAVRRVNLDRSKESLLDYLDPKKYLLLPNTAGCYTADEAIRAARLGREVGLSDWVKLEVIGDQATLYPDVQATLEATRVLVKEGFTVLPYTSDDIVFAKRLLDAGAATVMPLGAPIGSGLGIQNAANIRILREMITGVPLVLDAGVGTASDAALAMELGADAVLMNTGIANAQDPVLMAEAMKHAVLAGRKAYLAGRMPRKLYATASSPLEGVVR